MTKSAKTSKTNKTNKTRQTTKDNPVANLASYLKDCVQQESCFIPFNLASQCGHERVLYYNANAPADEIYECATERLRSVLCLLESLYEYDKCEPDALYAVASLRSRLFY